MIIVRDIDTAQEMAEQILAKMNLTSDSNKPVVLSGSKDPLEGILAEKIIFITSMPNGWLKYHQEFFRRHKKDISQWIVFLLNDNPVIRNQAENGFRADGIRLSLYTINPECAEASSIASDIRRLARIKAQKALLYSIRPGCGKRSLQTLLSESLPDWSFETMEEDLSRDQLAESDASHMIIVGKTIQDFSVMIPRGIQPIYVLTMPDENVQSYLRRALLPERLLEVVPSALNWSIESAEAHLFYISPLYEQWRKFRVDPSFDARFILWDEFGLPAGRSDYTQEKVQQFLEQFNQCEALVRTLAG